MVRESIIHQALKPPQSLSHICESAHHCFFSPFPDIFKASRPVKPYMYVKETTTLPENQMQNKTIVNLNQLSRDG